MHYFIASATRVNVQPNQLEESTEAYDDDDYEDLTYTGDSGFSEASQFLKTEQHPEKENVNPPPPAAQPGTYASLKGPTMNPVAYYKTTNRQELVEGLRGELV